jgi:hypothetical protein
MIRESRMMTPELYGRFEEYATTHPLPPMSAPPDLLGPAKQFTLASLPAIDSPQELAEIYFDPFLPRHTPEIVRRAYQDLATFGIPPDLSRTEFDTTLGEQFRESAFVVAFLGYLRGEESLRFGAVNDWIHQVCEDVPLPYRWEIKTNTHAFYNWLAYFCPEVTWDRPHHSQVIYWNRQ